MSKTRATRKKEIKRGWHLVDAEGEILGRLASRIAQILMGKGKPNYAPYLDMGDYVVVVNAKKVRVTGKKEKEKTYQRYSGYPGGLRERSLEQMRHLMPDQVIRHAVKGMLPKGKLGRRMITKLHVYPSSEHPYEDKFNGREKKK